MTLAGARVSDRLRSLGYREVRGAPGQRGEFRVAGGGNRYDIFLRAFQYPSHRERGRLISVVADGAGRVVSIADTTNNSPLEGVTLEPKAIADLHGSSRERRREMKLDEVPAPLVRAILLVEDKRFFDHMGLDLRGLARAMAVNVKARRVVQGGSTLTQQLMKNFFLTEERTLTRKLREAGMALVAERQFSKAEILENYVNEIYLGQSGSVGLHGMWEAAKHYFGKEPRELSLGETAMLAGMIRAPNYYSPHQHLDRALARRNVVLSVLLAQNEIDQQTHDAARAEKLTLVPPIRNDRGAPYFVDFVRRELVGRYPGDVLASEGFSVFTTLDPELQEVAEEAVAKGLADLEETHAFLKRPDEPLQAALIALNPRTGAVVAMVGGRAYGQTQFNRAVDARRQPGSVFKPIVYLAALSRSRANPERRLLPTSIVEDAEFSWFFNDQEWTPTNYSDEFYGFVSVREALERSLNVATAKIAYHIGIPTIRRLAIDLGMNRDLPAYPAIVLGGWETTPMEIAQIYGTFANGGLSTRPIAVRKLIARDGAVVEGNWMKLNPVVPPEEAYLVTSLLQGVVDGGTGVGVRRRGFKRPAAGKTGTTNDYNDAWFVGYTPDLLAVVWVGFDRDSKLGLSGSGAALPVWTRFMKAALAGQPGRDFAVPRGVVFAQVDPTTGLLAGPACSRKVRQAFLEGDEPAKSCSHESDWPF